MSFRVRAWCRRQRLHYGSVTSSPTPFLSDASVRKCLIVCDSSYGIAPMVTFGRRRHPQSHRPCGAPISFDDSKYPCQNPARPYLLFRTGYHRNTWRNSRGVGCQRNVRHRCYQSEAWPSVRVRAVRHSRQSPIRRPGPCFVCTCRRLGPFNYYIFVGIIINIIKSIYYK